MLNDNPKIYKTTYESYAAQLRKAQPEIDRIRAEALRRLAAAPMNIVRPTLVKDDRVE